MLAWIDLRGHNHTGSELRGMLPRAAIDVDSVLSTVAPIVEEVQRRGCAAARAFGKKFDGVVPPTVRVPEQLCREALDTLDPSVLVGLKESIRRVRLFHAAQRPEDRTVEISPGGLVTERWVPVERVGLYVPGGKAVYPSSVVMNVVPAQEAGVSSLVVASPPQDNGWPHPTILAACQLLGVSEVWSVGGAQAIALLAYGSQRGSTEQGSEALDNEQLEAVDLITGPGNIYVTAAKRLVRGAVGIDAEAGPTEIAIIADSTANPIEVAYDLISQAEHDPMAASVLITTSADLAQQVNEEVRKRCGATRNARRVKEALMGTQSGIAVVDTIDAAIAAANAYAAEHLEIHTANPEAVAQKITNAGAIFIGRYSPVPLGDYSAGSNHVLPTSGTARHSSGLSTHTFLKSIHVVNYTKEALQEVSDGVRALAAAERLPAHGEAIAARFLQDDSPLSSHS